MVSPGKTATCANKKQEHVEVCVWQRVCLSRYVRSVRACVRECNCANAHAHASHVLV
jgi:hypothetical protein